MASFGTDLSSAYDSSPMGGFQVSSHFEEKPQNNLDPRSGSQYKQQYQYQQQQGSASQRQASPPPQQMVVQSSSSPPPPQNPQVRYDQDMAALQAELQRYEQSGGETPATRAAASVYGPAEPSFLDSMWARRRDILKLVILSLLVVLAISFHSAIEHCMKKYILENDVSERGELMIRYGYPLAVLLLIWILKTASPSKANERMY
jgi:hypothetical protein